MSRFVIVFACVLVSKFVFGYNLSKESFEIRQGECKHAVTNDLVFSDHIRLFAFPFISRNGTSQWYGDQTIFCILALSSLDKSENSTVIVKKGGVNHTFVDLEFHSAVGHGLEYNVQSQWYGDQTIFCILALSSLDKSENSTVIVKKGGVNHTFVDLEFHSAVGHGLEYNVQVYAKLK